MSDDTLRQEGQALLLAKQELIQVETAIEGLEVRKKELEKGNAQKEVNEKNFEDNIKKIDAEIKEKIIKQDAQQKIVNDANKAQSEELEKKTTEANALIKEAEEKAEKAESAEQKVLLETEKNQQLKKDILAEKEILANQKKNVKLETESYTTQKDQLKKEKDSIKAERAALKKDKADIVKKSDQFKINIAAAEKATQDQQEENRKSNILKADFSHQEQVIVTVTNQLKLQCTLMRQAFTALVAKEGTDMKFMAQATPETAEQIAYAILDFLYTPGEKFNSILDKVPNLLAKNEELARETLADVEKENEKDAAKEEVKVKKKKEKEDADALALKEREYADALALKEKEKTPETPEDLTVEATTEAKTDVASDTDVKIKETDKKDTPKK